MLPLTTYPLLTRPVPTTLGLAATEVRKNRWGIHVLPLRARLASRKAGGCARSRQHAAPRSGRFEYSHPQHRQIGKFFLSACEKPRAGNATARTAVENRPDAARRQGRRMRIPPRGLRIVRSSRGAKIAPQDVEDRARTRKGMRALRDRQAPLAGIAGERPMPAGETAGGPAEAGPIRGQSSDPKAFTVWRAKPLPEAVCLIWTKSKRTLLSGRSSQYSQIQSKAQPSTRHRGMRTSSNPPARGSDIDASTKTRVPSGSRATTPSRPASQLPPISSQAVRQRPAPEGSPNAGTS